MVAGFNPLLAIGGGLASGIESAESAKRAKQDKIDDEYRKRAIDLSYETQLYKAKKDIDEGDAKKTSDNMDAILGRNKANTTNQMQYTALKNAQNNPSISQGTGVTGDSTPPPTNTPQPMVSTNTQLPEVQPNTSSTGQSGQYPNNQQITTQSPPTSQNGTQGGLNSPQGGEVPLGVSPQQGDATNPLQPPNSQQGDNINPTGGTTYANAPNDTVSTFNGQPLTREDTAVIKGYAMEAKQKTKGYLGDEEALAVGMAKWKDDQSKLSKSESAWSGGQDEIKKANTLGVPIILYALELVGIPILIASIYFFFKKFSVRL